MRQSCPTPTRISPHALLWLVLAGAGFQNAQAAEPLRYGAYWAGAKVGEAEVHIERSEESYRIEGKAWTLGLVNRVTRWRGNFDAEGSIQDGRATPESYGFHTRQRGDRTRSTKMADGKVESFRDGRQRDSGPAPDGLDMLTALFLPGECDEFDSLHTGTSFYELALIEQSKTPANGRNPARERCKFEVIDEDGDSYQVEVEVAQFGEHRIPVRIDIGGFLTGSVRILDMPSDSAFPSARTNGDQL